MYVCKMYVMYVKIVGKRQRSLEQIDVKEFDFRCVLDSTVFTNPKGNLQEKKKVQSAVTIGGLITWISVVNMWM